MHETYGHHQQTQRLRVAMSNVPQAAFLTIFEPGSVANQGHVEGIGESERATH